MKMRRCPVPHINLKLHSELIHVVFRMKMAIIIGRFPFLDTHKAHHMEEHGTSKGKPRETIHKRRAQKGWGSIAKVLSLLFMNTSEPTLQYI